MAEKSERTLKSLEEAIAYARGDCSHRWATISASERSFTEECLACKVRRTRFRHGECAVGPEKEQK